MKSFPVVFACALALLVPLRAQEIDVTHYNAELEFDLAQEILTGKVEINVRNAGSSPITTLPLHLVNLEVSEIEADGESLTWDQSDPDLTLHLASPLAAGDSVALEIRYSGHTVPEAGPSPWGGCHWNSNGVTFNLGVGFHADYVSTLRHWMPSHDVPWDKASFDVTFTVPDTMVVAAPGLLHSVGRSEGLASYRWVEEHPAATYLVNYAISDYVRFEESWQGIPMEFYVRRADSAKGATFFNSVDDMMEAFSSRFGPYPFAKAGYCVTPIGAMEHQTMISYPQLSFNLYSQAGSTAAHELAHQWWGAWVTPSDFRNAWLSEGFAVYAEMVYQEFLGGRSAYVDYAFATARNYKSSVANNEGIFPLYDFPRDPPSSNYPKTIYEKGGAVLAMLREVMGEEDFFEGLRDYGNTYAYGNASTADFQATMEQHYGESLDWFFGQWVYDKGWPDYTFETVKDKGHPLRVRIIQEQDLGEYPLFKMPIPGYAVTRSLDTVRFLLMNDAVQVQEFELPNLHSDSVFFLRFDPERLILSRQNARTVGVEIRPEPGGIRLAATYPNPVRRGAETQIPVTVDRRQSLSVTVFDTVGRMVRTFPAREYAPGKHTITVPTDSLKSGRYWVHISSASTTNVLNLIVEQ